MYILYNVIYKSSYWNVLIRMCCFIYILFEDEVRLLARCRIYTRPAHAEDWVFSQWYSNQKKTTTNIADLNTIHTANAFSHFSQKTPTIQYGSKHWTARIWIRTWTHQHKWMIRWREINLRKKTKKKIFQKINIQSTISANLWPVERGALANALTSAKHRRPFLLFNIFVFNYTEICLPQTWIQNHHVITYFSFLLFANTNVYIERYTITPAATTKSRYTMREKTVELFWCQ